MSRLYQRWYEAANERRWNSARVEYRIALRTDVGFAVWRTCSLVALQYYV